MKANPRFFVFPNPSAEAGQGSGNFIEVNAAEAEAKTDTDEVIFVVEIDQTKEGVEAWCLSFLGNDWIKHPDFNIKVTSIDNDLTKAMLNAIAATL